MMNIQGIMQHHDAVSGTAVQRVAINYSDMISRTHNDLKSKLQVIIAEKLTSLIGKHDLKFEGCNLESGKLEEICYLTNV